MQLQWDIIKTGRTVLTRLETHSLSSELFRWRRQNPLDRLQFQIYSIVGNPFVFDFGSEERANANQKQNTLTLQRGAEAGSRSKRNKMVGSL